jgi:hypothetical protein
MRHGKALACLVLLALAPEARAAAPLSRLAASFADAIAEAAGDRPVELEIPEDRTGHDAALALDLRALTAERLAGRVALRTSGPRLRVSAALAQSGRRLVVSARVVEEPGGALVDVLSASVEWDDAHLGLSSEAPPAASRDVEVVSTTRTPPLEGMVLDMAFVEAERLAVLGSDGVSLFRIEASGLNRESRQPLPGPLATVRAPGGMLRASRDRDLWAASSRSPRAVLFSAQGGRLTPRAEADALPWPGSSVGLHYRPGTNLIDADIPGLGPGPLLAALPVDPPLAVAADGELRVGTPRGPRPAGLRAGPALAALWPGLVAAASPDPPGGEDGVLLLACEGEQVRIAERIRVDGAVRALAARAEGESARLVAAVEAEGGVVHLVVMDLRRREP